MAAVHFFRLEVCAILALAAFCYLIPDARAQNTVPGPGPISPPVVTITATDPEGAEGNSISPGANTAINPAAFQVRRTGPTGNSLLVYYRLSGTASNGLDYRHLSGQVTIPAGAATVPIQVLPVDDKLCEGTETVVATVVEPVCIAIYPPPPECYRVNEPREARAVIRDNDPCPTNRLPDVEIVHPHNGQIFAAPADIEIEVVTRDPNGWVQTVQFYEGTNKIGEQSIYFVQPPPPGEAQKFSMVWSNVTAGAYVLSAIAIDDGDAAARSGPVEIKVVEPCRLPVVTLETVDRFATEQDPRLDVPSDTATVRVKRTCVAETPLTVLLEISGTASNGMDYHLLLEHVTIPGGAASADLIIEPIDDSLVEGIETVVVRVESPGCVASEPPPAACYVVGRPSQDTAYIRDNDLAPNLPPRAALVNPPDGSIFTAPADIQLVAQAVDPDGWVQTVEFFEGSNSLGIVTNHPMILNPLAGSALSFEDEALVRPFPGFQVRWPNVPPGSYVLSALATDNRGASTKSEPVEIKVVEHPEPVIVTVLARDPQAAETSPDPTALRAPDIAIFTVSRTGPTDRSLTVFFRLGGTASNGADYRELPNTVVIPAGGRDASVVVLPIDDELVEGTETVVLTLVESPCLDLEGLTIAAHSGVVRPVPFDCYLPGRNRSARAVILDNDSPPNDPPQVRLVQPQDGSVFLAPAELRLVAQAFDGDGRVKQVELFEGANSLGVITDPATASGASLYPTYTLGWSNVPPGHYVLTAVATDDDGEATPSEPVEIKVVERRPSPVVTITAPDPEATEQDPRSLTPVAPTATFTVHRTGDPTAPLTVYYRIGGTASNAVDYEFIRGHVTIAAGAREAHIVLKPLDDLFCEGDESVVLSLLPPVCVAVFPPVADCYRVGHPSLARAVIHDNDVCPSNQPPKVAIVHPENGDVFVAPADIRVCAEARDADGRVVRVDFYADQILIGSFRPSTAAADDIFCTAWSDVPPGGYVLTAIATDDDGASSRSEPVRIRVVERIERPIVTIHAADPAGTEPSPGLPPDVARFTVQRSCCTSEPLVVYFRVSGTADNGVDYDYVRGHVTIPAGAPSASVVIDPIDDNLVERTETVIIALQPPVCAAIWPPPPDCYQVGTPSRAVAYIRDNDSGPNTPPQVAILNPPEGAVFVAPANIEMTAAGLDPDGWVPLVEFFEGTNKIGESRLDFIQEPPPGEIQLHTLDWNNVPAGRYVLTARATDNQGASTVSGPIHIVVVEACTVPIVTLHAADPFASEADETDIATFEVRRSCALQAPLLVRYAVSGTAENGVDYASLTGEVLIHAGHDAARIVVRPIDDQRVEGTESVIVTLIQPRCLNVDPPTPGCYLVGSLAGRASAYLRDNDFPPNLPPRVAIVRPRSGSIFHAPEEMPITARARDADGWVTAVEFYEGTNLLAGMAILVPEPPLPGQVQTFHFTWSDVQPGHYVLRARVHDNNGASTWSDPVHVAVVKGPHPPVVTIHARDCYAVEGASPPNTATFIVRRSGPTNAPLTIHYGIGGVASNGADYVSIPNSITIPAGNRAARIVVTPIDDRLRENAETVILELRQAALYNVGRPGRAAAIIVDNDYRHPGTMNLAGNVFSLCLPLPESRSLSHPFSYRIDATSDFSTWTPVDYNTCVDDAVHFADPEALKMRFYRVVEDFESPDEE